jgi:hypothetical protein
MMRTAILPMLLDLATDARQCGEREAWLADPEALPPSRAREVWGCPGCVRRFRNCAGGEREIGFGRLLEVESC